MAKSKTESTKDVKDVEVVEEKQSTLYYFYSNGCGFCKKVDPIVEELIKEGHDILKLDVANGDNQNLKTEVENQYNKKCGTPFFIDADTGHSVCGYREKDILEKWVSGEDIPAPPRPTGPPPKVPFMDADEKELDKWKEEYEEWVEKNKHMPNLLTSEQILSRPRPKSEPPRPPMAQSATDEELETFGKKWDEWAKDNQHLPNLQTGEQIVQRIKQQKNTAAGAVPQVSNVDPNLTKRIETLEGKLDKLLNHLGVK